MATDRKNFFQSVKLAFLGAVLANCPHDSMAGAVVSIVFLFYFYRGTTEVESVVNNTTITGVEF